KIHQCSEEIDKETILSQNENKLFYEDLDTKISEECSSLLKEIKKVDSVLYNNLYSIYNSEIDQCFKTYKSGSLSYYREMYQIMSKKYSFILDKIGASKLYFKHQKEKQTNSLFRLFCDLKKEDDSSFNINEIKKEFNNVESPTFIGLTPKLIEILEKYDKKQQELKDILKGIEL
ncbi:16211_t:CDS:2, partial [Cetraspora pellucida]